ncbi:hypothetical protein QYE76_022708 [Lolium multiflorum]|uniref:Uncharacterized protein n=1 Tax=Lolium multiflorum TaxID=4521 RepID=A0AAD8RAB0_LOLMU|nr:hypothetical protein QYE76_022708 [Lolium multiflorum]
MLQGAHDPFRLLSSRTPSSRKPKPREDLTKGYSRLWAENTREKELSAGEESAGNSLGGRNRAIAIVIGGTSSPSSSSSSPPSTPPSPPLRLVTAVAIRGALPPALDLDSFPCVEEAIRVLDEFCDQYRALRREVEILREENQRLRRMLEYYSNPGTRPSPPHSGNNESLQVLVQNYKIEKLKLKEILMKRERNPSPSSSKE